METKQLLRKKSQLRPGAKISDPHFPDSSPLTISHKAIRGFMEIEMIHFEEEYTAAQVTDWLMKQARKEGWEITN